eukprot:8512166-Pyramimonas_sp.AAC.1
MIVFLSLLAIVAHDQYSLWHGRRPSNPVYPSPCAMNDSSIHHLSDPESMVRLAFLLGPPISVILLRSSFRLFKLV